MRRISKWIAYSLAGLLGLVLVSLVAVRCFYGPDEAATELAQHWQSPFPSTVPDADNAWLHLIGLGAAENDDPIALGRRRLDAHERRVALDDEAAPDAAFDTLLKDTLPKVTPEPDNGWYQACPTLDTDCIAWAEKYWANLELLEATHRLRLQRYERVLELIRFEEQDTPTLDTPLLHMDARTAKLHLDVIARDLSRDATRQDAFVRLQRVSAFWRRVGEQGRGLVSKMIADIMLAHVWNLTSGLSERLEPERLQSLDPHLRSLLSPLSEDYRDFETPLRREFLGADHGLRSAYVGPWQTLGRCLRGRSDGCLVEVGTALTYFPQATRNLLVLSSQADVDLLETAPAAYLATREGDYTATIKRLHPIFEGDFVTLYQNPNPAGRILAAIARPSLATPERRLDVEGLRRLHLLKFDATAHEIEPAAMPAYLESQPAQLRDPYTGGAVDWNPALQEFALKPLSSSWKRPRLSVSLRNLDAAGVFDCTAPVQLRFRRVLANEEREDLGGSLACSELGSATSTDDFEDPNDERWQRVRRFDQVTVAVTDGKVDVRLLWQDDDKRVLGYEGLRLVLDGKYQPLRATGHDDVAVIESSALPATDAMRVRMRIRDLSIVELGNALEQIKGIQLRKLLPACAGKRLTLHFAAVEVEQVLMLMGDECGRWPQAIAPGVYSFEKSPPLDAE